MTSTYLLFATHRPSKLTLLLLSVHSSGEEMEETLQSLQFENGQLRTELKAQQAANMKLRREKDDVLLALRQCKDENRFSVITYISNTLLGVF